MERSVLREVLLTHIHDLNETASDVFKPASKELAEAFRVHVGLPFLASAFLFQPQQIDAELTMWFP